MQLILTRFRLVSGTKIDIFLLDKTRAGLLETKMLQIVVYEFTFKRKSESFLTISYNLWHETLNFTVKGTCQLNLQSTNAFTCAYRIIDIECKQRKNAAHSTNQYTRILCMQQKTERTVFFYDC